MRNLAKLYGKGENSIMDPYEVILYPLMTESASIMVEKENKLVFVVSLKASKSDVKKAVEKLYEVKVRRSQHPDTLRRRKESFRQASSGLQSS